jgi:L,D-transpeptidase ErfK/SrfK
MKCIMYSPSPTAILRSVPGLQVLVLLLAWWVTPAWSATFPLPTDGSNLVGRLQVVTADARNTLLDIARHYDLGPNSSCRRGHGSVSS